MNIVVGGIFGLVTSWLEGELRKSQAGITILEPNSSFGSVYEYEE